MPIDGRSLRVLVADDDPSLRRALTLLLEHRGHVALPAPDTDTAHAILDDETPDVALIDAGMPRDGIAFWRHCHDVGSPPGGALLLTGDVLGLGDLAEHPRVLGKPFDFSDLMQRIERMAADATATGGVGASNPAPRDGEPS